MVLPPGIVATRRLRRRDFLVPLNVRYGLRKDVEVFAMLPLGLTALELSDSSGGTSTTKGGIGDLTAGLLYDLQTGKVGWPEMTAAVRVTAPTGDPAFALSNYEAGLGNGFWTVAALLNFVKSYDPLVIFASVGYRHDFQEELHERGRAARRALHVLLRSRLCRQR